MQLQLPLANLVLSILPFWMAILSRINSFALSFLNLNLSLCAEVVSMEACFASLKSGAGSAVLVRLLTFLPERPASDQRWELQRGTHASVRLGLHERMVRGHSHNFCRHPLSYLLDASFLKTRPPMRASGHTRSAAVRWETDF